MNTVQKIALSLLLAVLVFSGFSIAAFSGLFSYIETTFYDPRVRDSVERTLDRAADAVETYHRTVFDRFSAALGESAIRNVYRVNQSREDIVWRDAYFGELRERMPAFSFVRFVDLEGDRLWFSTLTSDVLRQDATTRVFRPLPELNADLSGLVLQPGGVEQDLVLDPQQNLFVYRFLVRDGFDIPRGTALFSVTPMGLRNALIRNDVASSADILRIVPGGVVLNATPASVELIAEQFGIEWPEVLEHQTVTPEGDPDELVRRLVFTRQVGSQRVALLVPESEFQMNLPMRVVLLVSSFLTTFLVAFLLLNLRQDATIVLSERVKRFQINFLREYMESKEELDWDRWSRELESRREDVRTELKRGVGGLKKGKAQEVDELFDKSWDEILSLIGSRRQITRGGEGIDLDRLESIIEKMVSNLAASPNSAGALSTTPAHNAKSSDAGSSPEVLPVAKREPIAVEDVEADEVEDIEEIEEIEDLDEAEELGDLDAGDRGDELGEAEELGDAEDAEELEEFEELEEPEAVGEVEELVDVEEVSELESIDVAEIGGAEERDAVDERDSDEEIEEAEAVDTVELLTEEPAVETDELQPADDDEPLSVPSPETPAPAQHESAVLEELQELEEPEEPEESDDFGADLLDELDDVSSVEEIEAFESLEAVHDDAGLVSDVESDSRDESTSEHHDRKAPAFGIVETDGVLESSLEDELSDTRRRDSLELYEGEFSSSLSGEDRFLDDEGDEALELLAADVDELEIADVDFSGLQPDEDPEPVENVDDDIGDAEAPGAPPAVASSAGGGEPLWNELESIREDWESPAGSVGTPESQPDAGLDSLGEGSTRARQTVKAELVELEAVVEEPLADEELPGSGGEMQPLTIDAGDDDAEELMAADDDGGEAESLEALENIYGGFTFGLFGFGTGEAIPSRTVEARDLEAGAELEELPEELELLDEDDVDDLQGADELDESAGLEELEAEDELEELDELEEIDELEELDELEEIEPEEASTTATTGTGAGPKFGDHGARSHGRQRPERFLPKDTIDRDAIRAALGSNDDSFEAIELEPLLAFLEEHGATGTVQVERAAPAEEASGTNDGETGGEHEELIDGEAYGIDDILSMGGGLDLMPVGPIGERIESRLDLGIEPDADLEDTKRLSFGEQGLDYDRFLSRFKRNEGGLFKSLIEFTRIWNAKFSAILVEKEGDLQIDYLLGLEDPCFNYLRIPQTSEMYQNIFGLRRLLVLQKTLQNYSAFRINCSDVEFEYVGGTVFVPIQFRGAPAYMMLGLGEVVPNLDTFFKTLVARQATFI